MDEKETTLVLVDNGVYLNRAGGQVGPLTKFETSRGVLYRAGGKSWFQNGRYHEIGKSHHDLVKFVKLHKEN